MYNRYIPQADGTYQKNQMQEPRKEPAVFQPMVPIAPPEPTPAPPNCGACPKRPPQPAPPPTKPRPPMQSTGVLSFLKQLLPKNFDAEDLLVVLLLLLMAGDCREDQNSALLTLALYLFL